MNRGQTGNSKRAVLYLRCSSDKQRQQANSIPAQERECLAYCDRNGYPVVGKYVDDGITGQTVERPGWRAMLAAAYARQREFDVIVAYDTSRFDRSVHCEAELDNLRARNVDVEYAVMTAQYDEDGRPMPEMLLAEGVQKVVDRHYVSNLARATRRGCTELALRGFRVGGPAPYGYSNVHETEGQAQRRKLAPEPDRAQIVAEIFRLKCEGRGNKAIRNLLNERGVPGPRGSRWNENTIREISCNRVYLGELTYAKRIFSRAGGRRRTSKLRPEERWIVTPDAHEPLVSQEIFDAAQSQRRLDKPRPRPGRRRVYILSGRLVCAKCGRSATARPTKSRHGRTTAYYACASGKSCGAPEAPARSVRAEEIESAALHALLTTLGDNRAVEAELARFAGKNRAPEVRELERRLAEAKRKVAHLLTLVEEDLEAAERWRARKRERDQLQRELDAMQRAVRVPTLAEAMRAVETIRERIDAIASNPAQADTLRSILHVLVASVKFDFTTRAAEITCRIPASAESAQANKRVAATKSCILAANAAVQGLRESVIAGA